MNVLLWHGLDRRGRRFFSDFRKNPIQVELAQRGFGPGGGVGGGTFGLDGGAGVRVMGSR
jgi:hypothetical protein